MFSCEGVQVFLYIIALLQDAAEAAVLQLKSPEGCPDTYLAHVHSELAGSCLYELFLFSFVAVACVRNT